MRRRLKDDNSEPSLFQKYVSVGSRENAVVGIPCDVSRAQRIGHLMTG